MFKLPELLGKGQILIPLVWGWGLRVCICNELPREAVAIGAKTTL
jgi:hypothetical protein